MSSAVRILFRQFNHNLDTQFNQDQIHSCGFPAINHSVTKGEYLQSEISKPYLCLFLGRNKPSNTSLSSWRRPAPRDFQRDPFPGLWEALCSSSFSSHRCREQIWELIQKFLRWFIAMPCKLGQGGAMHSVHCTVTSTGVSPQNTAHYIKSARPKSDRVTL